MRWFPFLGRSTPRRSQRRGSSDADDDGTTCLRSIAHEGLAEYRVPFRLDIHRKSQDDSVVKSQDYRDYRP